MAKASAAAARFAERRASSYRLAVSYIDRALKLAKVDNEPIPKIDVTVRTGFRLLDDDAREAISEAVSDIINSDPKALNNLYKTARDIIAGQVAPRTAVGFDGTALAGSYAPSTIKKTKLRQVSRGYSARKRKGR